jgi:branched-chain amino acid transport system permease protein
MRPGRVALLALILAVALVPLAMSGYQRYIATLWLIYAIAAVGLQIPIGLAAIYSFGHSAFMLIGAYTTGIFVMNGLPFPLGLAAGALIAAVFGAVLALPSLRLSTFALAIVTLGAASLLFHGVKAFAITGGAQGLFLPRQAFVKLAEGQAFYGLVLVLLALGCIIAWRVEQGPLGRSLRSAATNPLMAQSFGVDLLQVRTVAFVLSAIYGAVAGGLLGLLLGHVAPEGFSPQLSIEVFAAVMIGGVARFWGPVLGALFIVLIPELTQSVQNVGAIVYSMLFILVATLYPGGLQQWISRLGFWLMNHRSAT